ncbi:MAG TPA: hypothetical protein VGE93_09505, partial [Bryobacteraceae bacterium]
ARPALPITFILSTKGTTCARRCLQPGPLHPLMPCSVPSGGGGRWGAPEKLGEAEAAWRMLTLARQSRAEFLP